MLTTLANGGPKGGRWFSLIDKVWSKANLESSLARVKKNRGSPGIDRQSVEKFEAKSEIYLQEIIDDLRNGTYQPQPVLRRWIPKPGSDQKRPLGIPTVKDRVVQGALRHVLEPLWEARFADHSYGFRPRRSCHGALRYVEQLLRNDHPVVVDADIQGYFDAIPQGRLMAEVEKVVSDGRVLALVQSYLEQSVMDELKEWKPTTGTPQGAVISPLLANIYLHPVDLVVRDAGFKMVRYADDLVIMCRSREEADKALALLREEMTARGLTLHPEKTRIVDIREAGAGFDFLGYRFEPRWKRPRRKSMAKLKEKLRDLTPRRSGESMQMTVAKLNRTLQGWFGYFRHCTEFVFKDIDQFVRHRLRGILRRRSGRYGASHGHGADQQRWPKTYFRKKYGLYSLVAAWTLFRQSRCGNH